MTHWYSFGSSTKSLARKYWISSRIFLHSAVMCLESVATCTIRQDMTPEVPVLGSQAAATTS